MKKILIIIFVILFLTPKYASANSVKDLKFEFTNDIETKCPSGKEVLGCLHYDKKQVYINNSLSYEWKKIAIAHEIAHGLVDGKEIKYFINEEAFCNGFAMGLFNPALFSNDIQKYFISIII